MPRAKLSDVSVKQLVAEINRRKGRLADLLAQREAIRKAIAQHDAVSKEIAELESLGFSSDIEQAPPLRRGAPAGPRTAAAVATGKTLADYVRDTLARASKGLSVTEIERRVLASDYPTRAKRVYKQVMAVLSKGGFKKVTRGVYQMAGAARQAGQAAFSAAARAVTKTPAKAAAKARAKAAPKAAAKAKGARKRGQFAQTAEELIFSLTKGKGATTADINKAWRAAGRAGKADVDLSRLAKAGRLHRVKEGRGSRFTLA